MSATLAIALYDYAGGEDDELALRRGDVVEVTGEAEDQGWLYGKVGEQQGVFPATYIQYIDAMGEDAPQEQSAGGTTRPLPGERSANAAPVAARRHEAA